jgi:hypothetical protein
MPHQAAAVLGRGGDGIENGRKRAIDGMVEIRAAARGRRGRCEGGEERMRLEAARIFFRFYLSRSRLSTHQQSR